MSVVKDVDLEVMPMSIFINDDDDDYELNHSWSFLYEDTSATNVPIYHCNVSAPHLLPI